jgi:hypothetical protein
LINDKPERKPLARRENVQMEQKYPHVRRKDARMRTRMRELGEKMLEYVA